MNPTFNHLIEYHYDKRETTYIMNNRNFVNLLSDRALFDSIKYATNKILHTGGLKEYKEFRNNFINQTLYN